MVKKQSTTSSLLLQYVLELIINLIYNLNQKKRAFNELHLEFPRRRGQLGIFTNSRNCATNVYTISQGRLLILLLEPFACPARSNQRYLHKTLLHLSHLWFNKTSSLLYYKKPAEIPIHKRRLIPLIMPSCQFHNLTFQLVYIRTKPYINSSPVYKQSYKFCTYNAGGLFSSLLSVAFCLFFFFFIE